MLSEIYLFYFGYLSTGHPVFVANVKYGAYIQNCVIQKYGKCNMRYKI
jgi:hypothetical protein